MSDIAVKKLAETINAPVEVLLKQLQDAGIRVDGPDAWITDAQKLKLLAHIRQGAPAPSTGGGNKVTLKRREVTVGSRRWSAWQNRECRSQAQENLCNWHG